LQRLAQIKQRTKTVYSPLKKTFAVYASCQAIAATPPFDYPMNALKVAYDNEFINQSIDAHVDRCTQIRPVGSPQSSLVVDLWVNSDDLHTMRLSIIGAIIFIIEMVVLTYAATQILSAASSFLEKIFPKPKFYAPDGTVFDSLSEYVTYMQNVYNPTKGKPYTCMYCGQGFATAEERDVHQQNCPWIGGPPDHDFTWLLLLLAGVVVAIVVVPKIIERL